MTREQLHLIGTSSPAMIHLVPYKLPPPSLIPGLILALIAVLSQGTPCLAEAKCTCSIEVVYRWKKLPQEAGAIPSPIPTNTPAESSGTSETKPPSEVEEVFWKSIEAHGASEEDTKKELLRHANQEKVEALRNCRERHENLSGCIAAKFSSMSPTFPTLSFSARKSLEEAIENDCKLRQGECLNSHISEPKCVVQEEKVETEEKEGAKKENGKDGKGKKK